MAGGLQPTVPPSKEPPASAPTAFTSFRREKRELGIGPPEQGRMDTGLVLRGQYIAARPRHYPGMKAMGAKENSLLLLFEHLINLADFLLDLPASFSSWPSACKSALSVTFPAFSLTLPFNS